MKITFVCGWLKKVEARGRNVEGEKIEICNSFNFDPYSTKVDLVGQNVMRGQLKGDGGLNTIRNGLGCFYSFGFVCDSCEHKAYPEIRFSALPPHAIYSFTCTTRWL